MFLRGVEAEDYLAAARCGHRRIPFERVPVFGMKANDGIVAAVYRRDRGSRRSKIDSKKHNDLSRQSGGLAPTFVFTGCRRGWGRCYDLTLIALLRSWGIVDLYKCQWRRSDYSLFRASIQRPFLGLAIPRSAHSSEPQSRINLIESGI